MAKTTPMMQQYRSIKEQYADAILFFRLGDFYEMFSEDAVQASRALEITLTTRGKGTAEEVPMCGVPHHSADRYIARLTRQGYKVAICDQVEDASQAKGLVERDVVRVVTPGTDLSETNLQPTRNNWLAVVVPTSTAAGMAFLDGSTGELWMTELEGGAAPEALAHFSPREVLFSEEAGDRVEPLLRAAGIEDAALSRRPPWSFDAGTARERLLEHLDVASLEGFGCQDMPLAERAASAGLAYLQETQRTDAGHVRQLRRWSPDQGLRVDATTRRNLELIRSLRENRREGTLLHLLDDTVTPMGGRLLQAWILQPVGDVRAIGRRQEGVGLLLEDPRRREALRDELGGISDLERLTARCRMGRAGPRDLHHLRCSIQRLAAVREHLDGELPDLLQELRDGVDPLQDLQELLDTALVDDPPAALKDGGVIREGHSTELDELRDQARGGRRTLAAIEAREKERTGIGSLKVRHNKVFGYFLEVSKANLDKVPEEWTRRQTLTNSERYVTEELKEVEGRVLGAQERAQSLEERLFAQVRDQVGQEADRLQSTARALARLDVLSCLARVADRQGYVRPTVTEEPGLRLEEARHPVVETLLSGERFVPNDARLDPKDRQILLLTGPNMGGKSTYLRQTALIVLMAHMGSFVPAREAEIGRVDRIFTRVGAADNLTQGQSTFMVEMLETANILNNATPRSLVVLDEIGRGTATFDGLSLAWSVVEHLHEAPDLGCMTLFATHYHELTDLSRTLERVHNLRVAVREWKDRIVFLRRVEEGTAERSYGIHVARLAGLPPPVLERAREILANLERNELDLEGRPRLAASREAARGADGGTGADQLSLFGGAALPPEITELLEADVASMTPLDALNLLAELQERLGGRQDGDDTEVSTPS